MHSVSQIERAASFIAAQSMYPIPGLQQMIMHEINAGEHPDKFMSHTRSECLGLRERPPSMYQIEGTGKDGKHAILHQ